MGKCSTIILNCIVFFSCFPLKFPFISALFLALIHPILSPLPIHLLFILHILFVSLHCAGLAYIALLVFLTIVFTFLSLSSYRHTPCLSPKYSILCLYKLTNSLFVCVTIPILLILIKDTFADFAQPHPCSAVYTADSYNTGLAEGC